MRRARPISRRNRSKPSIGTMLLQAGYHPARASGPTLPSSSCYASASKSSRTPGRALGGLASYHTAVRAAWEGRQPCPGHLGPPAGPGTEMPYGRPARGLGRSGALRQLGALCRRAHPQHVRASVTTSFDAWPAPRSGYSSSRSPDVSRPKVQM